jgi:hypothetical protein
MYAFTPWDYLTVTDVFHVYIGEREVHAVNVLHRTLISELRTVVQHSAGTAGLRAWARSLGAWDWFWRNPYSMPSSRVFDIAPSLGKGGLPMIIPSSAPVPAPAG